jgi:type I restriction enzyme S subunit
MKNSLQEKRVQGKTEWLDRVPAGWDLVRLKRRFRIVNGATPQSSETEYWDGDIIWITPEDLGKVSAKTISESRRKISDEGLANCGANLTPAGSIVISTRAPIGHLAITEIPSTTNQGAKTLLPDKDRVDVNFYYYALLASKQVLQAAGKGTTFLELSSAQLGSHLIPVPPISEQKQIANLLDIETAKIDELIARKRRLIEKLEEKRLALIARTVTRGLPPEAAKAAGLDANPEMKDSGVPWIGPMPQHWRVMRLKRLSDRITVGVVVNPSSYVSDEGVPFLLGGDVREFRIDISDCKFCTDEASRGPLIKSRLTAGDIVVVRVGYPGVAAVVPPDIDGANCASMMIVGKNRKFDSHWLAYAMNAKSGRDQVELVQYGAAQKQFNISHAVDFTFPFPCLEEQRAIASYLDCECERIEKFCEKISIAIDRLTEYRQALITSAVTGRIDVRHWKRTPEAA